MFVKEWEELFAEGVCVRAGEFTLEMGEGVEPCEAELLIELWGWETGCLDSLGGCAGSGGWGGGCLVVTASMGFPGGGSFWG